MTVTTLSEHEAQVKTHHDKSEWLGRLMWYHVETSLRIPWRDINQQLISLGLTEQIPPPPRNHDVWRRVTTAAERRKVPTPVEGVFDNYRCVEVSGTGDELVTKRIVREQVDRKGHKLHYEQIVDLTLHRSTGKIDEKWLENENAPGDYHSAASRPEAGNMVQEIRTEFNLWKDSLGHYAIRQWIRRTIQAYGATAVRPSGGIYFLREEYADKVEALEDFVASFQGQSECHSLPLVDDAKQREMVKKAFEAETNGEIDNLLKEVREIRTEGKNITDEKWLGFIQARRDIQARAKEYADILETEMTKIESRLELLETATFQVSALRKSKK